MELIWEGLRQAVQLLIAGDPEMISIALLTLRVSGTATLISVIIGVPLGVFMALQRFRFRHLAVGIINTGMGIPPTVVGLFVSILMWRYGPLGFFNLMYTPTAIIIAQSLIALPLVTGFTMAGVQQLNPKLSLQILAIGASRWQFCWLLIREARLSMLAAVIAGFGGVVSEVGASMMVGGNIRGHTRVLTTAVVMEVSRGHFAMAIALSIILLALAFAITMSLTKIQQRGGGR